MRSWRRVLGLAFFTVALALLVIALASRWGEVREALTRLDPWAVVLSFVLAFAALIAQMLSWRALLAGTGDAPPLAGAARVYFVGQLGKYVPGGVWSIAAQAGLGQRYHVGRTRSAVAALASMALMVTTGAVFAVIGLVAWSPASISRYWWALVVIPLGLVGLAPPVFNRVLALLERMMKRPGQGGRLGTPALLRSIAWSCVMWVLFGLHSAVLITSLHPESFGRSAVLGTGAFALAWVVGFLIVFAPAGAGPREAALVLALAPAMASGDALLIALISRVLLILGDAATAGAAALAVRLTERSEDGGEVEPPLGATRGTGSA